MKPKQIKAEIENCKDCYELPDEINVQSELLKSQLKGYLEALKDVEKLMEEQLGSIDNKYANGRVRNEFAELKQKLNALRCDDSNRSHLKELRK